MIRKVMIWAFIVANNPTNKACEILQADRVAMKDIVMAHLSATEDSANDNDPTLYNNWYLNYTSEDVYTRLIPPTGPVIYTSRDAAVHPETGVWAMYHAFLGPATLVITAGANVEFTCFEEEDGTRKVSVFAPFTFAIQARIGQVIDQNIMEFDFVFEEGRWLCVKVDLVINLHEIVEMTGDVSMIERYAILDQITSYLDALETSANTHDPCVLNNWLLANAVEDLVMIQNVPGLNWYSLSEVLDYDNGMYAKVIAHVHHVNMIFSIGANLRYSSIPGEEGPRVVQVKTPVHVAVKGDEYTGQDDQLSHTQWVYLEGKWKLKRWYAQVQDFQVLHGEVP